MASLRPEWLKLTSNSRLHLLCLLLALLALGCQRIWFEPSWPTSVAIVTGAVLLRLLLTLALKPLQDEITALNLHAQNLQDGSFNTAANQLLVHELRPLADSLMQMSTQLQQQRASLYQRELLLDTVLQSSPAGLILTNDKDVVLMTNPAARKLLYDGKSFTGTKLSQLNTRSAQLNSALNARQQGLIRLDDSSQSVWHLAISQFHLNQSKHWLYLLKPLTRELQREELNAWKKLLRVIGHELNNTLAPLSSLAYSGSQLAARQQHPQLAKLFDTITGRCNHLNQFLQAYIQFAKLPPPEPCLLNWAKLINQLQDHYEFELLGSLPQHQWYGDPAQLAQMLLNLLKNAHESGSPSGHISLEMQEHKSELKLILKDGGGGMSAAAMEHALVPFYSTKPQGSGIGLTLCRDIIEAHGGNLNLHNTQRGLTVTLCLPRLQ